MIFYFTCTGNCLYVAKELDKELVSIPQVRPGASYEADVIGLVCPVFAHDIPSIVRDFLRNTTLKAKYFYVILTYGYCQGGISTRLFDELKEMGKPADYINVLKMVDNALPAFDIEEELRILPEKKVEEHLAAIRKDIEERKKFVAQPTEWDLAYHEQFLKAPFKMDPQKDFRDQEKTLYEITDRCIGCGICTRVCPKGCLKVVNRKAHHDMTHCIACLACIHACPQKAIQFTFPEKNPNARYRNSHIRLPEIIKSNWQK